MVQMNNFSWLTEPQCISYEQDGDAFDQYFSRLLQANHQDLTVGAMTQLRDLEKMASVPPTCASQRQQQARFFFWGGQFLEQMNYKRSAYEYYALCERRLPQRDFVALLALHTTWVNVTETLGYLLLTLHSYRKIVTWLQMPALRFISSPLLVQQYQRRLEQCRAHLLEGEVHDPQPILPASFTMSLLRAS
jgi:hypothetical protein